MGTANTGVAGSLVAMLRVATLVFEVPLLVLSALSEDAMKAIAIGCVAGAVVIGLYAT